MTVGLLPLLIGLTGLAVLGVLFAGLVVMARGGDANRKWGNILMRWRVSLQFAAVLLILIYVFLR